MNTDRAWEIWGARDPYFAVLTAEEYRSATFDEAGREAFFRSGETHVAGLMDTYEHAAGRNCRFGSALDFGCGVARLVIPLASRFERLTGVDVSRTMLDEARSNCSAAGAANVRLLETAQFLDEKDSFDLVHSVLVFQHIRPHQGLPLLANLLSRVAPDGVAAVQFIFGRDGLPSPLRRLQARMPFVARLSHGVQGKPYVAPMEMYAYDLDRVLALFQDQGLSRLRLSLSRMGPIRSATIVGVRDSEAPPP